MLQTGDNESIHLAYGEANLDFPVKKLKYRYNKNVGLLRVLYRML